MTNLRGILMATGLAALLALPASAQQSAPMQGMPGLLGRRIGAGKAAAPSNR